MAFLTSFLTCVVLRQTGNPDDLEAAAADADVDDRRGANDDMDDDELVALQAEQWVRLCWKLRVLSLIHVRSHLVIRQASHQVCRQLWNEPGVRGSPPGC